MSVVEGGGIRNPSLTPYPDFIKLMIKGLVFQHCLRITAFWKSNVFIAFLVVLLLLINQLFYWHKNSTSVRNA